MIISRFLLVRLNRYLVVCFSFILTLILATSSVFAVDPEIDITIPTGDSSFKNVSVVFTNIDTSAELVARWQYIDNVVECASVDDFPFPSNAAEISTDVSETVGTTRVGSVYVSGVQRNGRFICVRASDGTNDIISVSSAISGITNSAPVLRFAAFGGLETTFGEEAAKTLNIDVVEEDTGDEITLHWKFVTTTAGCSETAFSDLSSATLLEGPVKNYSGNERWRFASVVFSDKQHNGKYFCVRISDGNLSIYENVLIDDIIDPVELNYVRHWVSDSLSYPVDIAISPQNSNLYVLDDGRAGEPTIVIFTQEGTFVSSHSLVSDDDSYTIVQPHGIVMTNDRIFVSVADNIKVFDHNFAYQTEFGASRFDNNVLGLSLDSEFIYVSTFSDGIAKFDLDDYSHEDQIDTTSSNVDVGGNFIYTLNSSFSLLHKFKKSDGGIVNGFGYYGEVGGAGYVDTYGTAGLNVFGRGSEDGQFSGAEGISVTDEYIYVTDEKNSRVSIFSLSGDYLGKFGEKCLAWFELSASEKTDALGEVGGIDRICPGTTLITPDGIVANDSGDVFFVDKRRSRVYEFSQNEVPLIITVVEQVPSATFNQTTSMKIVPNRDGTVSLAGGCHLHSSTVGGSAVSAGVEKTLVLSGPSDAGFDEGDYTCTLTASSTGVDDVEVAINFKIDRTRPVVIEITPVSTPTRDINPEVVIRSNEDGIVHFNGCLYIHSDTVGGVEISAGVDKTLILSGRQDSALSQKIYQCGVLVTDEAGNHGTLGLTHFEVTSAVPILGERTPVSTPSTDLTPEVVIFSNNAGTISLTGGCHIHELTDGGSSISGGNVWKTLRLSGPNSANLAEGTYDCIVSVTAEDGTVGTLPLTQFRIAVPPVLVEVTPVASSTRNQTPSYTFSTTKVGDLSVGGSCGTSSSKSIGDTGEVTITLTDADDATGLSDDTYDDCTITVTNSLGDASSPLTISTFTVDTTAPEVTIIDQVRTPTNNQKPTFTVTSNEDSIGVSGFNVGGNGCYLNTNTQFGFSISANVLKTAIISGESNTNLRERTYNCSVSVTDGAGNSSTVQLAPFVIDTTAPTVAEVTPVPSTTSRTPSYTFSTTDVGDLSVGGSCGTSSTKTITAAGDVTITLTDVDDATGLSDGTYADCTVTVTDAAGNASPSLTISSFVIDTSDIAVKIVTQIEDPVINLTPSIVIQSDKDGTISVLGQSCYLHSNTEGGISITADTDKTVILSGIADSKFTDGIYTCRIAVTATANGAIGTIDVPPFFVDTTPPVIRAVSVDISGDKVEYPEFGVDVLFNQNSAHASRQETLTPILGGRCDSFKISHSITSRTPANGIVRNFLIRTTDKVEERQYNDCTLQLVDGVGNASNIFNIESFGSPRSGGGGGGVRNRGGGPSGFVNFSDYFLNLNDPVKEEEVVEPTVVEEFMAPSNFVSFRFFLGQSNPTIKEIQTLLNNTSCLVSLSGAGSKGQETEYFGPRTQNAVKCYQRGKGLAETGIVDTQLYESLKPESIQIISVELEREKLIAELKKELSRLLALLEEILLKDLDK